MTKIWYGNLEYYIKYPNQCHVNAIIKGYKKRNRVICSDCAWVEGCNYSYIRMVLK